MYIDISFEMFTLIDVKGIPVLYCVCVCVFIYVVTPVLLLQGLVLFFVCNKELLTVIIQRPRPSLTLTTTVVEKVER